MPQKPISILHRESGKRVSFPAGTPEQEMREAMDQFHSQWMMSHPPTEPEAPDFGGEPLSMWQRLKLGTRETDPERLDALGGGEIKKFAEVPHWRPPGATEATPWTRMNPKGFDVGDVAQYVSQYGPQTVGAIAASVPTGGAGVLAQMGAGLLGGAAGKGVEEGIEWLTKTQQQDLSDASRSVAIAGLEEGFGGLLGGLTAKGLDFMRPVRRGAGGPTRLAGRMSPSAQADFDLYEALRMLDPSVQPPMRGQVLSETGIGPKPTDIPAPVLGRVAKQVGGMTGQSQVVQEGMEAAAGGAVRNMAREAAEGNANANDVLVDAANRIRKEMFAPVEALPTREQASAAVGSGAKAANKIIKDRVSSLYNMADDAAARERPVFDLSRAQNRLDWVSPLTKTVEEESLILDQAGRPMLNEAKRWIDAAPAGPERLARVERVLRSVDPIQTNYDAIKWLRTQAGDLIEDWPHQSYKDAPARALYDELTTALRNPLNGAPQYVAALDTATDAARVRFNMLEDKAVLAVSADKGTARLINQFVKQPDAMFTPEMRRLLADAPPDELRVFRDGIRRAIYDADDPAKLLYEMRRSAGPEAYEFLFRTPAERDAIELATNSLSRYWNSPQGQMVRAQNKGTEALRIALDKVDNRADTKELLAQLNPGERETYRKAVIEQTIDRVFTAWNNKTGERKIDAKKLRNEISRLQKVGIWDTLRPDDRVRLEGLEVYYRRFLAQTTDVGTSLEVAAAVADLKGVISGQFLDAYRGMHTLAQAKMLSRYLTDQKGTEALLRRVGKVPRDKRPFVMPLLALPGALNIALDNMEEGPAPY